MKTFLTCFILAFCKLSFGQFEDNYDTILIFGSQGKITKNATDLYGVINRNGETVIPFLYNKIIENKLGLFVFKINKSTGVERTYSLGYYNHNFSMVLPCNYKSLLAVDNQFIIASQNSNQKFGLVDTLGRIIIDFKYDEMVAPTEGLFLTKIKGKYGFINKKDHVVIDHEFEYAAPFSEELAVASKNHLVGYINHKGNFVIPDIFIAADDFHYGFAQVYSTNNRATIIDKIGTFIFPPIFESIESVGNLQFIFKTNESYRNTLENVISETNSTTNLNENVIDTNYFVISEDTFDENIPHFKGVLSVEGKLIGGNDFNDVIALFSSAEKQLYAVQRRGNREDENASFNYALMNEKGELVTGYDFFDVRIDEKQVLKETETGFETFQIDDSGNLVKVKSTL